MMKYWTYCMFDFESKFSIEYAIYCMAQLVWVSLIAARIIGRTKYCKDSSAKHYVIQKHNEFHRTILHALKNSNFKFS